MSIFWEQIRKANDFVEELCNQAIEGKSVVLSFPEGTPWGEELCTVTESLFRERSYDYAFVRMEDDGSALDALLLDAFCSRELRALYRQNMGIARFLGGCSDTTLHSSYVWVRVQSESRLREWVYFVSEYIRQMPPGMPRASFIFEAEGLSAPPRRSKGISQLSWTQAIDDYDIYTFCALESAEISISPALRPYLVELASRLCFGDVELARACVRKGETFLSAPETTLRELAAFAERSNGEHFHLPGEEGWSARIWEAQIRCCFAALEKYRSAFIQRHRRELQPCLPFRTRDEQDICQLRELELGHLIFLINDRNLSIGQDERDSLSFLRHCRNELAHLNMLPFEEVKAILLPGELP